ncbi:MAG: NAD+ synthase [Actinomycetota bacterium]
MIRLCLAQVNPTIGDLEGNASMLKRAIAGARAQGGDLVAFPELVITGYPPDDLLLSAAFVADSRRALESVAEATDGITAIVGCVDRSEGRLYSAAAFLTNGRVQGVYHKRHLPNYGVFDERRFFSRGSEVVLGSIDAVTFGVTVCEDLWVQNGPHRACAAAGASLVVNINASPYHAGKGRERLDMLSRRARENGLTIAYVNCVGGADEVVFDGQSCIVNADGSLAARAAQFTEELLTFDFDPESAPVLDAEIADLARFEPETVAVMNLAQLEHADHAPLDVRVAEVMSPSEEVYCALVTGVRDYLHKNSFRQAIVGLSGGIDSALTAAIAVDALGAPNVLGISNPSEFTSPQSIQTTKQLAHNLGIELVTMPIGTALDAMRKTLEVDFPQDEPGVADQNLQSRIRGALWMAVSNLTGRIVLSTGNKSELAVGYATLYGDMVGGFAALKDVPKTLVYQLADWRNRDTELIPDEIIRRPPTAELAPNQLDTDALPPYEVLDPILDGLIAGHLSIEELVEQGFDRDVVVSVASMVDRAEFKRRQAPPGVKITRRAFGRDRRLPITNRYRRR